MATTTPQLLLRKPAGSDLVDETADLSDNMDKIDAASQKVLGYSQVIAPQVGIAAVHVDLVGLSVGPVTVGTTRRLKITGSVVAQQQVASALVGLFLYQDGLLVQEAYDSPGAGTGYVHPLLIAVLTPAAGAHTYKLAMSTQLHTVNSDPTATRPAFILVEDIGAA